MEENVKEVKSTVKANDAKKDSKKKKKKKDKKKKNYINPYKTTWGKILIWILCISMALGTVATLIYLIVVNFIQKV